MPLGKKTNRSNRKSFGWEPSFGPHTFFVAPTDLAGARHWFPADGISFSPFWLVVYSSVHMVIQLLDKYKTIEWWVWLMSFFVEFGVFG